MIYVVKVAGGESGKRS